MKIYYLILVVSLLISSVAYAECTTYTLNQDNVADCGDSIVVEGTQSVTAHYEIRQKAIKEIVDAEIQRQHELAVESEKVKQLGLLQVLSAPQVTTISIARNETAVAQEQTVNN